MLQFCLPLPLACVFQLALSWSPSTDSSAPDKSQNLGLHSLRAISTPAEPPCCTEGNSVAKKFG